MTFAENLLTLKVSNGALKGEKLPSRLKVLPWGDSDSVLGKVRVGDETARQLSVNQRQLGYDRVAIDFDHCTVPGSETNKALLGAGQPPLIFGYGSVKPVPGEGIFLDDIVWTPLGLQHARNFEDLSPAINKEGPEVLFIHSIALTPNGAVKDLQFFKASLNMADVTALSADKKKCDHMNEDGTFKGGFDGCVAHMTDCGGHSEESAKKICGSIAQAVAGHSTTTTTKNMLKDQTLTLLSVATLLGLPETTAEADVLAKLKERLAPAPAAAAPDLTALNATIGGLTSSLTAMTARVAGLETKLAESAAAATKLERGKLITLFSAEGKVPKKADGTAYTAEELNKLDVSLLQLLHANTPVTVPLSARSAISQTDGARGRHVEKDASGKIIKVDLAAMFDEEAAARGTARPNI